MTDTPEPLPYHVRLMLAVRKQRGWSQAQLAQQLELSRRTIIRYETGQQEPRSSLLPALRSLLHGANLSPETTHSLSRLLQ